MMDEKTGVPGWSGHSAVPRSGNKRPVFQEGPRQRLRIAAGVLRALASASYVACARKTRVESVKATKGPGSS